MNWKDLGCIHVCILSLLGVLLAAAPARSDLTPSRKPNVILIVVDDLDFADLSAYSPGTDIQTPSLDGMAAQSMRFSQYYANGPVCSPTRTSLLSGAFPSSYGVHRAIDIDSYRGLPGDVYTLAEMFSERGYFTGHVGKWHLGTNRGEFLPSQQGFDYSVRWIDNNAYTDFELSYNDGPPVLFNNGEHLTETLTDHAIDFLVNHHDEQRFFLNLWYTAPHQPLTPPVDYDNSQTQYDLSTPRGKFAAMVSDLDLEIGRLFQTLQTLRRVSETVVIFCSDNGGAPNAHTGIPRAVRGFKRSVFEGGIRVPLMVRWPGMIPGGSVNDSPVLGFDLYPTLAELLSANTSGLALEGKSFLPLLSSNHYRPRTETVFWETKYSNNYYTTPSGIYNTFAVRLGDMKYVFQDDREKLFDLSTDPGESTDLSLVNPQMVRFLRVQYDRWRKTIGDLAYTPRLDPTGVQLAGNYMTFTGGGAVEVGPDPLFDFNDGDFTFATSIRPDDVSVDGTVACKDGSWSLELVGGALHLSLLPEGAATPVVLQTPALLPGSVHRVAFTAFGWRNSASTLSLYLDGVLVDENNHTSIPNIPKVSPSLAPILFGNDPFRQSPFLGQMKLPRISVLSLYPTEIVKDVISG